MDRQRWLRIVAEHDGWEIAFVPFGDRNQKEYRQCTANARLVSAAPEMQAVLIKTKAALLAEPFFATDPELAELFDEICAALAKARGA